MKNKEKYYEEILEIIVEGGDLAVDKNTNKPRTCRGFNCDYCLFKSDCYGSESRKKWLEAEYQEAIHLTDDEIVILKNIDKQWKWIARDKNGKLFLYANKPCKSEAGEGWFYRTGDFDSLIFFDHLFQFVNWEDEEPYSIGELLRQNGVER